MSCWCTAERVVTWDYWAISCDKTPINLQSHLVYVDLLGAYVESQMYGQICCHVSWNLPSLRGSTVSGIPTTFNMNCTFMERS